MGKGKDGESNGGPGRADLLLCGAVIPLVWLLQAWVLGKVWGWFLVGLAGSVPPVAALWGLLAAASVLRGVKARSPGSVPDAIAANVFGALYTLLVAWLASMAF